MFEWYQMVASFLCGAVVMVIVWLICVLKKRGDKMYLSNEFTKLVVMNQKTGEEIAVITNDMIDTADDDIVVRLTPSYGDEV